MGKTGYRILLACCIFLVALLFVIPVDNNHIPLFVFGMELIIRIYEP
jgi:hypothetical protein